MRRLTNAEKLLRFVTKNGVNSLDINPIPKTNLWLVAQYRKNKWIIIICNPSQTITRPVTSLELSEEQYKNLWIKLIAMPNASTKPKDLVDEYRKEISSFYKNYTNNNN